MLFRSVRLLLTQPVGGSTEKIYTVTGSTTRIETDISSSLVYSYDIFVNNNTDSTDLYVKLTDTSSQETIDGSLVIRLADAPPVGAKVRYVLYLNNDGADAWKSTGGADFVANQHDVIEWSGTQWEIIFDASTSTTTTYMTNLNTGQQFYYNNFYWQFAVDGYYPRGTWDLII